MNPCHYCAITKMREHHGLLTEAQRREYEEHLRMHAADAKAMHEEAEKLVTRTDERDGQ